MRFKVLIFIIILGLLVGCTHGISIGEQENIKETKIELPVRDAVTSPAKNLIGHLKESSEKPVESFEDEAGDNHKEPTETLLEEPQEGPEGYPKEEETLENLETIKQISYTYFTEGEIEEDVYMVVFTIETCKPCNMYKEIIKKVLKIYPDAPIYELKADKEPDIRGKMEIPGFPLTFFIDKEETTEMLGVISEEVIINFLNLD